MVGQSDGSLQHSCGRQRRATASRFGRTMAADREAAEKKAIHAKKDVAVRNEIRITGDADLVSDQGAEEAHFERPPQLRQFDPRPVVFPLGCSHSVESYSRSS